MKITNLTKKQKRFLDDKYEKFLNKGRKSTNSLHNPRNLFDDLTPKDQIWLKITRNYLARVR